MSRHCSFCGERPAPGSGLVTGPEVAICRDCASIATEVLSASPTISDQSVLVDARLLIPHPRAVGFEVIDRGAVVIRHGDITWIGDETDLPERYRGWETWDCEGRVVLPGLVDAGTWLLAARTGMPADPDRLIAETRRALGAIAETGITTVDVRCGGSDQPVTETVLLASARAAGESVPIGVVVSWMVAASLTMPALQSVIATASRLATLALILNPYEDDPRPAMLQPVRSRLVLEGVPPPPGEWVSVEYGTKVIESVDQVLVIRPDGLIAGGPIDLGRGCLPALASGYDPSGVELPGLGLSMLLAVELGSLGVGQVLWAATRGSALALGDDLRGLLRAGAVADISIWDTDDPQDIVRRPMAKPWRVLVGGTPIY